MKKKRKKHGSRQAYSQEILDKIRSMALKGVPDVKIAKELGITQGGVAPHTTALWEQRMAEAQLKNIDVIDAKIITPDGKEILI